MKRIGNKILICLGLAAAVACAKLEEPPYGIINGSNQFSTPENCYSSLLYAYQSTHMDFHYITVTEIPGGIVDVAPSAIGLNRIELKNWVISPTLKELESVYMLSYNGITRANTLLENIDSVKFPDEALKQQYIGEAKFVRSFYYFFLVRLFGEVPVFESTDMSVFYNTPVSSLKDVYDFIIKDLEFAEANVPEFKTAGRADKTAARAQLAKVYLHIASSAKYGSPRYEWATAADMYAKAAEYAGKVYNDGAGTALYGMDSYDPSSDYVYTATFPDNKRESREKLFVWSTDLDSDEIDRNQLHTNFMPYTYYSQFYTDDPTDFSSPVKVAYWGGWGTLWLKEQYWKELRATGDKRIKLYMENTYDDETGKGNVNLATGPEPRHFTYKYASETGSYYQGASTYYFLRWSDIALVYAEAAGNTPEGYKALNLIRKRAGLSDLSGLSDAEYDKAVWLEREKELALEGHQLFDLRRTRRVHSYLGRDDIQYAYFYPIPQQEVDLNPQIKSDEEKINLK